MPSSKPVRDDTLKPGDKTDDKTSDHSKPDSPASPVAASASSAPFLPFQLLLQPYGSTGPTASQATALRQGLADGSVVSRLLQLFQQANPGVPVAGLSTAVGPLLTRQVAALDQQLATVWAGPRPSTVQLGGITYAKTWSAESTGTGLRIAGQRSLPGAQLLIAAGPAAPVVGLWQSGLLRGDGASQVVIGSGLLAGALITATGRFESGGGADALFGHGVGIGVVNQGLVDLGPGSDRLFGTALFTGVVNTGRLRLDGDVLPTSTAPQDDELLGLGAFTGIANSGRIDASIGTDRIIGAAAGTGVLNGVDASISLGAGRDLLAGGGLGLAAKVLQPGGRARAGLPDEVLRQLGNVLGGYAAEPAAEGGIVNHSSIDTGDGGDIVYAIGSLAAVTPETTAIRAFTAQFGPHDGVALVNAAGAELKTGSGDDLVLALGHSTAPDPRPAAVANAGLIDLGDGRDRLLAPDGFTGTGLVRLGDGDDAVLGFGSGRFDFGTGRDSLGLPAGDYRIRRRERSLEVTRNGDTAVMRTWNLEAINGVGVGSLLNRPDGAFTVGSGTGQVPLPTGASFDIAAGMAEFTALL